MSTLLSSVSGTHYLTLYLSLVNQDLWYKNWRHVIRESLSESGVSELRKGYLWDSSHRILSSGLGSYEIVDFFLQGLSCLLRFYPTVVGTNIFL